MNPGPFCPPQALSYTGGFRDAPPLRVVETETVQDDGSVVQRLDSCELQQSRMVCLWCASFSPKADPAGRSARRCLSAAALLTCSNMHGHRLRDWRIAGVRGHLKGQGGVFWRVPLGLDNHSNTMGADRNQGDAGRRSIGCV